MTFWDKVLLSVLAGMVLGYIGYAGYVIWDMKRQMKKWDAEARVRDEETRTRKWRP